MKVGAATLQLLVPLCLASLLLVFNTQARRPDLEPEPVVDRQGNPLQPGVGYYVLPIGEDKGGLAWGETRNQTCPLSVIREPDLIGSHVLFSAPPGVDNIPTLTDLTITMPILGPCLTESRVWRLRDWIEVYFWFIRSGGVAGDLYSKFQIVRREVEGDHGYEIYSFKYCPSAHIWAAVCFPVGIFEDSDGTQVLAVRDVIEPYYVWFQKVDPTTYPNKNQGFSIV